MHRLGHRALGVHEVKLSGLADGDGGVGVLVVGVEVLEVMALLLGVLAGDLGVLATIGRLRRSAFLDIRGEFC